MRYKLLCENNSHKYICLIHSKPFKIYIDIVEFQKAIVFLIRKEMQRLLNGYLKEMKYLINTNR